MEGKHGGMGMGGGVDATGEHLWKGWVWARRAGKQAVCPSTPPPITPAGGSCALPLCPRPDMLQPYPPSSHTQAHFNVAPTHQACARVDRLLHRRTIALVLAQRALATTAATAAGLAAAASAQAIGHTSTQVQASHRVQGVIQHHSIQFLHRGTWRGGATGGSGG